MEVISYSEFSNNLASTMSRVVNDHNLVVITNVDSEAMVLMSLKEFNAYEETAHLLKNPNNAQRLRESLSQVQSTELLIRPLIEV